MNDPLSGPDGDSFLARLEAERPRVIRLLAGLVWHEDDPESLTQEVFTRAWEQRAKYDSARPLPMWLSGIAVNVARESIRRATSRATVTDPQVLAEVTAEQGRRRGVLSGILKRELHQELYASIAELPAMLREAIVLHDLEGLDYVEVCELTGVSEGALRVRIHRARALLRDALKDVAQTWWEARRT